MKKVISMLFSAVVLSSFNVNAGLFDTPEEKALNKIKTIEVEYCDNIEFGEMINAFTNGTAIWEAKKYGDNSFYINVSGDITYRDKPEGLFMQYLVSNDGVSFVTAKLSGKYISNMKIASIEDKMCDATKVIKSKRNDIYPLQILNADYSGEALVLNTNLGEKYVYALGLSEYEMKLAENASLEKAWVCVDDLEYPNHIYPSKECM